MLRNNRVQLMLLDAAHQCLVVIAIAGADAVQIGVFDNQREHGDAHVHTRYIANNIQVPAVANRRQRILQGAGSANFDNSINTVAGNLEGGLSPFRRFNIVQAVVSAKLGRSGQLVITR